jgi:hypothetical protein
VQSQIETYRAKAKEFTRLTVVAKSLRRIDQILIVTGNATPVERGVDCTGRAG